MNWQSVITAAGDDRGFLSPSSSMPKNLVPTSSGTIITDAIRSYKSPHNTVVVIKEDEDQKFHTSSMLRAEFEGIKVVKSPFSTRGGLATACLSLDELDSDSMLVVSSGDSSLPEGKLQQYVEKFVNTGAEAGALFFYSSHPRCSFLALDSSNLVTEVAEKRPISKNATTGTFFFKTVDLFELASRWVFTNNVVLNGSYFLSSTLNYLIARGDQVAGIPLENSEEFKIRSLPADLGVK